MKDLFFEFFSGVGVIDVDDGGGGVVRFLGIYTGR